MRSYIESITATSGFLEDCRVTFSPALNCIIGARGTCKSTLIESIRFAFDHDVSKIQTLTRLSGQRSGESPGMIRATLGHGSVRCSVVTAEGQDKSRIVLERELDGEPRIFMNDVSEHADRSILRKVEIYSQGDLQRIAEDPNDELRIALIDRPNAARISEYRAERENAGRALASLGLELRGLRSQMLALQHEVQPTADLRAQLIEVERAQPVLSPELESERVKFDQRRRALGSVHAAIDLKEDAVRLLEGVSGFSDRVRLIIGELEAFALTETQQLQTLLSSLLDRLSSVERTTSDIRDTKFTEEAEVIGARFAEADQPFFRLRQEQQQANEFLKQQQHLQRQIEHLERRGQELGRVRNRIAEVFQQRQIFRDTLSGIDNEMFKLRISEVDSINREHSDRVHLTLHTADTSYATLISTMLGGSRLRSQDEVALQLAQTFSPPDLVDIVEAGDSQKLAGVLNRDLGQMNRVIAHLGEHSDLYQLEANVPKPRLEITLFDGGVAKPVESLSEGQKATALLPLILRPLPYPLLFDQPEDDLDNSFIFRSLIQSVAGLKTKRQIIFVTHNANIPVLGGAEQVIVMKMKDPKRADLETIGTVDSCREQILELLEGGAAAFRLREQKYGDLLKNE